MNRRLGPVRKRLRVNTGCRTCRTRRVKCDEEKPTCRNCSKRDRTCTYDSSPGSSGANTVPSTPAVPSPERQGVVTGDDKDDHIGQPPSISPVLGSILRQREQSPSVTRASNFPVTPENVFRTPDSVGFSERVDHDLHSEPPSKLFYQVEQIQLTSEEVPLFRNYVQTVSHWIDSFSPDKPFYSLVPVIALNCHALMRSCLALGAKQLALKASADGGPVYDDVAVGYYQKAVQAVSLLLTDPTYARNDGILASSIILSTYEMLEPAGGSFGSHLKGIAFFLQERKANGDAQGIKGAAYWTWYRHEIWAALQTGRRMFLEDNYWQPAPLESFSELSVENIANRVIFLFGQCVSFCNNCAATQDVNQEEAVALDGVLEQWKQMLPSSMAHFCAERPSSADGSSHEFPYVWFLYPQSAVAYQVYHASKILLRLHCPLMPSAFMGTDQIQSLSCRREIEKSREQIFLISNAGVPDTLSLISTQCLFVAGLVTDGVLERQHTLKLIESCQRSSGRRTFGLADRLRELWAQ